MTGRRKRTLSETIRHDVLRILLERMQGEMQSKGLTDLSMIPVPENVEEISDIPYINRHGIPLAMDITKPKVDDNTELPVVITIHGGGLVAGDRKISRPFSLELAKRGYLVFSIEYRLAPRANVAEEFDDVCAGMDFVGQKLVDFNVDFTRIFLVAESAGAFLATYVAAMKRSRKLQDAIGYKPTNMVFRGIGLISGMFYTRKKDPLGMILAEQLYGDKFYDHAFMQFMDPEHPEIVRNLPPAFLITSRGDFLNRYTLDYHEALKKAGRRSHLVYYGEESLGHAFPTMQTNVPQSQDAIDRMLAWFEQEAYQQNILSEDSKEKKEQRENLLKRMKSGELNRQKLWEYILETSSVRADTDNALAIIDNERRYLFRRLRHRVRQYAEVFSGMGITGKQNRRIGILADTSAYAGFILLGANMTGTPVSFFPSDHRMDIEEFFALMKEEQITDLILEDHIVPAAYVRQILAGKDSAGIKQVIISHRHVDESETVSVQLKQKAAINRRKLKEMDGLLYMKDLFVQYEAAALDLDESYNKPAVLTHQKNADGTYRTVSFTDEEINECISTELLNRTDESLSQNLYLVTEDFSHSTALVNMFLVPLAAGDNAVFVPYAYDNRNYYKAVNRSQISVLITSMERLNELLKHNVKPTVFSAVLVLNEDLSNTDYRTLKELNSQYGTTTILCLGETDPQTGVLSGISAID